MQMPTQAPLAPLPPRPPQARSSYAGLRTGVVMLVVVIGTVLLAGLLPSSVVTARNIAYPQPNISVSASTAQAHTGDTVQFTVQVKAGNELTFAWDFGSGPESGGTTMSHTYSETCQQCTITVTATDPIQHQATASTTLMVAPPAPTASFTFQEYDTYFYCIQLDASGSSGENLSYAWDYGDGSTDTGSNTTHCYYQSGTYTVTLNVTDDFGQSAQTSQAVHV